MQLKKEFKNIAKHYNTLIKIIKKRYFVGIINEWIVDNYYLIVEKQDTINSLVNNHRLFKYTTKNVDMFKLIANILQKYNYTINEKLLIKEINRFQRKSNYSFMYKELAILPVVVLMLLIKKISEICKQETLKIKDKRKIDRLIIKLKMKNLNNSKVELNKYFKINNKTTNFSIVYLNERLKELDKISNQVFKQLNDELNKNNLSLKNIINKEHLENTHTSIMITNIFNSIRKMNLIEIEHLYNKLSDIEKLFKKDKYYSQMTLETKALYRKQLIRTVRKNKKDPIKHIDNLLKKGDNIGQYLFNNKIQFWKTISYLIIVFGLTVIISNYLASLFIPIFWLGFILLLNPVSELVIAFVNKILLKFFRSKPLPKLDFSKGIPNDCKTMIVIPTIIKDEEKIKVVFEKLETFYLANKTDNLYFSLLGDCMEHNHEYHEKDQEIITAANLIVKELNKKYNKEIFYFVYRRRKYNSSEESWLGYERKRGALLHFNDLILGNLTKKEQEDLFNAHSFDKFKEKIKYVITLDIDNKLVLNSAIRLIGTIAHPLNKPILNKSKNKVISGYGIIQPRISVDVDSTNKSLFSQIYAGIGGFDPYSALYPNFYQDVFQEGCFTGKGIYDLEVYQQVLKNRFPNNLILSHDLIEGNYLRCAEVTDIELIDDFPSKFLVDASRRSRWARGDMQIIGWLFPKVKNAKNVKVKNPLTLLGKWKIFDNIRRGFLDFNLLIILILTLGWGKVNPILWLGFILLIYLLPVISGLLYSLMTTNKSNVSLKYYNYLMFGHKAFILRTLSVFSSAPFNAYLYISSFVKALYRMLISKKRLLNWITAEDAEKFVKSTLNNTIKQFWPNYIVAIIIILLVIKTNFLILGLIVAFIMIMGPIIAYLISKDINALKDNNNNLIDEHYLYDLSEKTWKFFADNINEKNNYLIPDNYQLNRDIKEDIKTSPSNIGFSLISIVSAYELEFIDKKTTINLINKIVNVIEKLPKWNGHLYNWYNIKTLEIMLPNFVSSVDSANLVASFIVVKEFLKQFNETKLTNKIEKLIDDTDFSTLYTYEDVFSVGYNADEGRISPFNYNKFVSESRIISFVAIAKGDVPSRHWFNLDKTLTSYKGKKGLVSWSGTSFEYFMPLIFIKSYPNTLLDESYDFAYFAQKQFMREVNPKYPWGVSESAYNELDDAQNYKYKAFGTPYLKLREESLNRIAISPYSSILAITEFPKQVISNMKKFNQLNMIGEYGFYDAFDVNDQIPVLIHYSHHQGMILTSFANYLKNGVIQKYFNSDIRIKAVEILIKEKVQVRPVINLKIMKYKKYTYQKEPFINDIRSFHYISTLPELSVLSNSKYSTVINDRGSGFSRYRTIQMNRYRKITEQDYGMFVYIKDVGTNKIWSNTYAPMNVTPDKYEVVFALDRIKFIRSDDEIITTTEIVVTKVHNAEIRKITFKNNSDYDKYLELTTYTEPILCENSDDITHRAFNNLFITSEYDKQTNSIIMFRKIKNLPVRYYMINKLLVEEPYGEFEYETNRVDFIGRNNDATNPIALNKKLSNFTGASLDPIVSLRTKIKVEKNDKTSVFLISGFGKSREQALDIVRTYCNKHIISEQAFEVATLMSNVTNKMAKINENDMRLYNTMLNYLFQTNHICISDERKEILKLNTLNQSNLWRFGISGDRPMILLIVHDIDNLNLVKELLYAFEYYKSKSILIDLIIINSNNEEYAQVITKEIDLEKYRMNALNNFHKVPGNIYLLNPNEIDEQEYILFSEVARLIIDSSKYQLLYQFINEIQRLNTISGKTQNTSIHSLPVPYMKKDIKFFNGYGGFINQGKEYLIVDKNTPVAWSNVIVNKNFGTVKTNNNCGFTYAFNSHEFKLTTWTNDNLLTDLSEGIKFNKLNLNFDVTKFGFGYNEFVGKFKKIDVILTEFVALEDSIKFYKLKIKNNAVRKQRIVLDYWINPSLGINEEKTSRHLLCTYDNDNNYVTLRNVYSRYFNNVSVFMTSTMEIDDVNINRILFKEIETSFYLEADEEKEVAFMLGCATQLEIKPLIDKYNDIKFINEEFERVQEHWSKELGKIQVNTPDDSFNYMVNGWLLYQTISSRIYARAGFYQVGGAYGFRDQLQDAMNICTVYPEMTKAQILFNARYQFKEGDVMHWIHKEINFGLRSLYKDDHLWLIYATSEYLNITEDYNILNEQVPFVEGPLLEKNEKDRGMECTFSEELVPLYEHCRLAINKSMNELGENGLPLIGGGDWNDGMNKVGIKGFGTSVWLGFFLYQMINKFIDFTQKYDSQIDIAKYLVFNEKLKAALRKVAWDGNYYLRAFFDNNHKLGSSNNKECSIDLISQSFAILTEVADDVQTELIIDSVEERLVDKKLKIIKLLDPPFENNEDNPGYIMDYPKGIRENGGQYTHATAWYIMALLKTGMNNKAFEYYQMINPINRTLSRKDVLDYKVEPYVIAADIYSNPDLAGRGGWTWYTGSSGWFYRVAIIDILGFYKRGNKLFIKPKIPTNWKGYDITYNYEDTVYEIHVIKDISKKGIQLDKKSIKEDFIELKNDKKKHVVTVRIGG